MKKTRTDAWGEGLPEETRRQLYAYAKTPTAEEREAGRPWLRDYDHDLLPYLSLQGIVAPSKAGWYRFLQRMRIAEAEGVKFSVEAAKRIAEGVVAANVDARLAADYLTAKALDAATASDEASQKAAAILAAGAAKFHAAALAEEKLKLDAARQKTADEQLRLAREKFEAAEKRLAAVQGAVDAPQLSDEERLAKIKSIFGMK